MPGFYTGFYWWGQWMNTDPAWATSPLWEAWWAAESSVRVPQPWSSWSIWQFYAKFGPSMGSQGLDQDISKARDKATFDAMLKIAPTPPPPPPPPPPVTEHTHVCSICGETWNTTPNPLPPSPPPVTLSHLYRARQGHNPNLRSEPLLGDAYIIGILQWATGATLEILDADYNPSGFSKFQPNATYAKGGYVSTSLIEAVR